LIERSQTDVSQQDVKHNPVIMPWLLRLLLAGLLLFGSEVLLWTNLLERTPLDWLLAIVGYVALATLVLDLAVRYRVRDLYDAMALMAIYGLCAGLFVNPEVAQLEFPRTFVTRMLGGYTLLGLQMFGLFLVLTSGENLRYSRLLVGFSLWLGFYWGIWMRWAPPLVGLFSEVDPEVMLISVSILAGQVLVLYCALRRMRTAAAVATSNLRLSPIAWGILLVVLLILFMVRTTQEAMKTDVLFASLIALVACMVVLWFRRTERGSILLDSHIPPDFLSWRWILTSAVAFVVMAMLGYNLPLFNIAGYNQFAIMEIGFMAVGFGWLPTIAIRIGVRALDRQMRVHQP
jgi:hypothetical protein